MDHLYHHNLLARLLLTLVCLGYGVGLILADLNQTHSTNPHWTAHARFHVVWQVLSYTLLAGVGLGLIWVPGPVYIERLYLACALSCVVFVPFFGAILSMKIYAGSLADDNGIEPVKLRLGGSRQVLIDKNVTVFSILIGLLIGGFFAISPGV